MDMWNESDRALGYEQITSLAASTGLNIPAGTRLAIIIPETQGIRYRDDGVAPTASVGMPLAAGAVFQYTGNAMTQLRFIEQTASAKLNISYYG